MTVIIDYHRLDIFNKIIRHMYMTNIGFVFTKVTGTQSEYFVGRVGHVVRLSQCANQLPEMYAPWGVECMSVQVHDKGEICEVRRTA